MGDDKMAIAREFVTKYYPKARSVQMRARGHKNIYVWRIKQDTTEIGHALSETEAWINAAENMVEKRVK